MLSIGEKKLQSLYNTITKKKCINCLTLTSVYWSHISFKLSSLPINKYIKFIMYSMSKGLTNKTRRYYGDCGWLNKKKVLKQASTAQTSSQQYIVKFLIMIFLI